MPWIEKDISGEPARARHGDTIETCRRTYGQRISFGPKQAKAKTSLEIA